MADDLIGVKISYLYQGTQIPLRVLGMGLIKGGEVVSVVLWVLIEFSKRDVFLFVDHFFPEPVTPVNRFLSYCIFAA